MNDVIEYNVVDALILSILDTDLRIVEHTKKTVNIGDKKLHKYDKAKLRVEFKFDLKLYGLYKGVRRRPSESDIIKKISNLIHSKLKIDILTIKFYHDLKVLDLHKNTNYNVCISIILDVSVKSNKNNKTHIIPINEFINPFSSTSTLKDIAIGAKLKIKYPKVYDVLRGNPGYMWVHYYTSIMRLPWFNLYYLIPNTYVDYVPSLLEYFAGMDEICLFDIVCKFHVKRLDKTKYKSYVDMRHKLKKIFIGKITDINKLKFDQNWRLHPYELYRFNNIKYLKLEYVFGNDEITVSTFIGFIHYNNIEDIIYIINKIRPDILYKNLRNIRNHILITNLSESDKRAILSNLHKLEESYLQVGKKLNNNSIKSVGGNIMNNTDDNIIDHDQSYESSESESIEIIYM